MPLLLMVVAAVLVFVGILVLLAVAALSEYAQLRRIHFDPAARPFTLSVSEAFDPAHVILWSTQIPALQLIASGGSSGVDYRRILTAYEAAARVFPELYEGSSFAQWLFFLQRSELVTLTSYRVKITEYGRDFLHYCKQTAVAA